MNIILQTDQELTKANADIIADGMIAQAIDSPIEVMVKLKYLDTIMESVKKGINESFKDKIFAIPGGKLISNGATIQYQNGYDEADYEKDEEYAKLKAKLEERKTLLKTAFKAKHSIINGDEVIPVLPVGKIVADKVNITLKKQ